MARQPEGFSQQRSQEDPQIMKLSYSGLHHLNKQYDLINTQSS